MRTLTTMTLALGAALAAATFAAAAADAAGAHGRGTRPDGAGSLERFQLGSVAAPRGAAAAAHADVPAGVGPTARPMPAGASAPCPGGNGGVAYLNGLTLNGWTLNGRGFNTFKYNGAEPAGTGETAGAGALRVTSVRLPDGRAIKVRPR